LPRGNASPGFAGTGSSRRNETVAYQSSRIVRHTKIPQGMVKRMSLSVLLDQTAHWEGQGAARHRVLEPPKPETIQSIKGLLTAATGLNSERGDQLIIESLPFETTLNPETAPNAEPVKKPAPTGPKWLQMVMEYRDLIGPAAAIIAALAFFLFVIFRLMAPKRSAEPSAAPELEGVPRQAELESTPAAGQLASGGAGPGESEMELTERVRQMASRDVSTAANVVRLWLQETKT